MKRSAQDDSNITQKAADWFFVLEKAGAAEHAAFGAWLRESPRHVQEFLMVTAAYRQLDQTAAAAPLDREALRNELRGELLHLSGKNGAPALPADHERSRRSWRMLAAAASVLIVALLAVWAVQSQYWQGHRYATDIGEIRSVELEDGSVIQLNTRSRVQVNFSADARELQLLAGEALFKVARDAKRPFRVRAGSALVQALGTEFNIYRRASDTRVAVLEGAVRVTGSGATAETDQAASQTLAAGQEVRIGADGELKMASVDKVKITAWQQRRLVFRGDRLREVAVEFNRYNRAPRIRVDGKVASSLPLEGIFDANDPESLVQFLAGVSGLETERRGDEVIIRSRP